MAAVADAWSRNGREGGQAKPLHHEPAHDRERCSETLRAGSGSWSGREQRNAPSQQAYAGFKRVSAQHDLQELGHEEYRAHQSTVEEEHRDIAGSKWRDLKQAHRNHRLFAAPLPADK
jgi:hypothetical protein